MGNGNSFQNIMVKKNPIRAIIIGLDNAGKSTIVNNMELGEIVNTVPTIGFNVDIVEYKKSSISCWDVGGEDKVRGLYRHYFPSNNSLIFVVDSNDKERIKEAKDELYKFINEPEIQDWPLLVYANKQDLPYSLCVAEIVDKLELHSLPRTKKWYIQAVCGITADGIIEGLEWLSEYVKKPEEYTTRDPASFSKAKSARK